MSDASYMFRLPTVAIFREVFTDKVLNTTFIIYVKIHVKIYIKIYVKIHVKIHVKNVKIHVKM